MHWEELRDAVQRPLGGRLAHETEILVVELRPDDGDGLVVELDVGYPPKVKSRWRLVFPRMVGELARMSPETARLVLRANIEEWWHTRAQYPDGMPGVTERRLR